jgi:asparagine synthase (glutamine-hydrolysing)
MCGICGKLNVDGNPVDPALIQRMNDALAHRGPDDEGIHIEPSSPRRPGCASVGLGHKRLSIIDLSTAGRQPMTNEDKTVWMVFNGEVYNFQDIKKELLAKGHRFSSHTDSETIIHLYEEEGIGCLKRLNGMFSIALWDSRTQTLFLCRDRLGIKPLVYFWDGRSLVFASEIRGVLCDPAVSKDIHWGALDLYLTFNYIPAPHTIFQNIYKLNPGSFLTVHNGELKTEQYWDVKNVRPSQPGVIESTTAYKNRLYHALKDAVRLCLIADVPLGAFLSGGVDSSVIVGLMSLLSPSPVNTFSIGYEDMRMFDETHYAREVAAMHRTNHHEIKLHSRDMRGVMTDLLNWFDEPFADSSAIPTFIVSRETKRRVRVALSGDGGDELFAGYRMYAGEYWYARYRRLPRALREGLIEPLAGIIPDARDRRHLEQLRRIKKFLKGARDTFEDRFFLWNEIFSARQRADLLGQRGLSFDLGKNMLTERLNTFQGDAVNRMLYADLTQSLPNDMLAKVDGMSMKNALEVRVPLLDHRVVELAFQMPGHLKLRRGKGKYIFLETFKDILPPSLLKRPKWGFEVPIGRWLKTDLKFLIDDYLDKGKIERQGIFQYGPISQLIRDLLSDRADTSWQLWNLIVFQAWYRRLDLPRV